MRPIATPLLDQLLAAGVINARQHERAVSRLAGRPAEPYANLGDCLAWLMAEKIVFLQEVARLQAAPDAKKPVDSAVVAQTLAEWESASQRQQETRRQAEKAKRAAQRPLSVVPGPAAARPSTTKASKAAGKAKIPSFAAQRGSAWRGWARKGVYGVIAAGFAYWLFTPDSPMDCDNDGVWRNVGSILSSAQSRDVSVMMNPSKRVDWFWAQPTHIEQIGYARSERTRACRGTLVAPTRTAEVAFTISPDDKGDFYVKLASPKMLQARYGQSDSGDGGGKAAPIGPVRIRQIFMEAASSFEDSSAALASVRSMEERRRQRSGQAPGGTEPVRDVVPVGDCRHQGRDVWTCRLVAEYRDRVIGALGGGDYQVLEGEFDFEASGSSWRASDSFAKQFAQAVLQARMEAAGVTPPGQGGGTSVTVEAPPTPRRADHDRANERTVQDAAAAAAAAADDDPSSWPDTLKPPADTVAEPEPIEPPGPAIYEPAIPTPVPAPVQPSGPPSLELTMPAVPSPPRVLPPDMPATPEPVVPIQIDPPRLAPIDVAPAPITEPRRPRERERENNDAPRDRLRPGGG